MTEKKYGIIGKPLSHSLSPVLQNFWFKKNNLNADYSLIEIEKNQIKEIISKIKTQKLYGINVTIPYKQEVIPFLDLIINFLIDVILSKISAPTDLELGYIPVIQRECFVCPQAVL